MHRPESGDGKRGPSRSRPARPWAEPTSRLPSTARGRRAALFPIVSCARSAARIRPGEASLPMKHPNRGLIREKRTTGLHPAQHPPDRRKATAVAGCTGPFATSHHLFPSEVIHRDARIRNFVSLVLSASSILPCAPSAHPRPVQFLYGESDPLRGRPPAHGGSAGTGTGPRRTCGALRATGAPKLGAVSRQKGCPLDPVHRIPGSGQVGGIASGLRSRTPSDARR